jgi:undecaprenyl-diphosphatase
VTSSTNSAVHKARQIAKPVWAALGLMAVLLLSFIEIAEEVKEGELDQFDRTILLAFRNPADLSDPLGPRWMEEMMRDFTGLGSMAVLLTIAAIVVGFLFLTGKRQSAWVVSLSLAGGVAVSSSLKWLFARPRPDLVAHATTVYTHSFPSGHAMLSAVAYLTIGALLARTQAHLHVKLFIWVAALILTVIVGISRVYLGVHWPSDVLAGWTIGASWALLSWAIMVWLQDRKKIEQPTA